MQHHASDAAHHAAQAAMASSSDAGGTGIGLVREERARDEPQRERGGEP